MATKHGLNNDDAKVIKAQRDEKVIKDSCLSKKETKIVKEITDSLKMPIEFTDEKFTMGEGELDVRKLNEANYKQMLFRQNAINNIYLKSVNQSLIDTQRLLMLLLKKMGVDNIYKELNELLMELAEYGREGSNKQGGTNA